MLERFSAQHKKASGAESQAGISTSEFLSKYPEVTFEEHTNTLERLNAQLEENRILRIEIDRLKSALVEKSQASIELTGGRNNPIQNNRTAPRSFRGTMSGRTGANDSH